jgi:hypothetical protein
LLALERDGAIHQLRAALVTLLHCALRHGAGTVGGVLSRRLGQLGNCLVVGFDFLLHARHFSRELLLIDDQALRLGAVTLADRIEVRNLLQQQIALLCQRRQAHPAGAVVGLCQRRRGKSSCQQQPAAALQLPRTLNASHRSPPR